MNLYAESSAVLAWLLREPAARAVRKILAAAEIVIASDLTLLECDRALIRLQKVGDVPETEVADMRSRLSAASGRWNLLRIDPEIVERARRPFPGEPMRTLDALHLASALVARSAVAGLTLLSLDHRIRGSGQGLGFEMLPR